MPDEEQEFIIYTDESEADGKFYSNFYGGAILPSSSLDKVNLTLTDCKERLGLTSEIKWTKTSKGLLDRYMEFIDTTFDLIENGDMKFRIMCTQNIHVPKGLSHRHHRERFELLYYQFIKHAFGLVHAPNRGGIKCRVYLDQLPSNREQATRFKAYLIGLNRNPQWRAVPVRIMQDQIVEIDSSKHIISQSLDLVLGSMHFRLNDKHKEKIAPRKRGARTIAKEKLYKHINKRICKTRPGFNIGGNTGTDGDYANLWHHPYRHWLFVPSESERDLSLGKRKKTP